MMRRKRNTRTSLIIFILFCAASAATGTGGFDFELFDSGPYSRFLERYVVPNRQIGEYRLNVVDYDGIYREKDDPGSLYREALESFARFDPANLPSQESRVAFWINAYNMGAIKMIIDHHPVKSIRSGKINLFKNPWGKKILTVGERVYSLGEIEHDILLGKLGEPLAHFAVVCASLSCPEILSSPYRGATLKAQLERQSRKFLGDERKGIRIDREGGEVFFSRIFKFDKKTFPGGARDAIPLIEGFLNPEDRDFLVSGPYRRKYLDYDWSLNALRDSR